MTVKDRVLEALEANRGTWFSGESLAGTLGVSRSAVWKAVEQLRGLGYPSWPSLTGGTPWPRTAPSFPPRASGSTAPSPAWTSRSGRR